MNNFPTLLGHEPRFTGIVPGSRPLLPPEVIGIPYRLHYRILLKEEKIYRFPLVVRSESVRRINKHGVRRNSSQYRWMLFALSSRFDLYEIEHELSVLNRVRKERGERPFPLLACDISFARWDGHSHLNGENVRLAPAFVPAYSS